MRPGNVLGRFETCPKTCGFFILRGGNCHERSVKHALFSPVYERAMPAIGPFRCLRCMRSLLSPIAGMARSYTNIGTVSSFGVASGTMKVSVFLTFFASFASLR